MCYIIENSLERCHKLGCVITELVMDAETKLASMTADRNDAMGSLIVAEAVAKDEVEKRKAVEVRLAHAEAMWLKYEQAANNAKNELGTLKASISEVEDVWREQVQGYDGDWTEDTLLQAIAEEFEFQATEDVEITVTILQTVTVRKPIGTNLNSHDFWMQKDCELLECNYEITEEESASVEDVSE